MKLPSKFISYKNSCLSKFPVILKPLEDCDYSVKELYNKTKASFESRGEFIDTLDCLFVLGKIELLEGVVHYVKNN